MSYSVSLTRYFSHAFQCFELLWGFFYNKPNLYLITLMEFGYCHGQNLQYFKGNANPLEQINTSENIMEIMYSTCWELAGLTTINFLKEPEVNIVFILVFVLSIISKATSTVFVCVCIQLSSLRKYLWNVREMWKYLN